MRSRDNKVLGEHKVEDLIERFKRLAESKTALAESEL